jgi:hypothetical protein
MELRIDAAKHRSRKVVPKSNFAGFLAPFDFRLFRQHLSQAAATPSCRDVRFTPIVLQKSKVAGLRIFVKNPKREAIADLYNLNRATEVPCKFNVPR